MNYKLFLVFIFTFFFYQNIFAVTLLLKQKTFAESENVCLYDIADIKDGEVENTILFKTALNVTTYDIKDLYPYITKALGNYNYIVIGQNVTVTPNISREKEGINNNEYDTPEKKIMSDAIIRKLPLTSGKDEYYKITYLYKLPSVDINTRDYDIEPVIDNLKKEGVQNIRFNVNNKRGERVNWFETVVEIYKMKTVYVAKMGHEKGSLVVSGNFEKSEFRSSRIPSDSIMDVDKVQGARLNYNMQKGNILREFHMKNNLSVKKGETVKAVLNSGGVYVQIDALASEDGYDGKKIKMKNKSTGKYIEGYVRGNMVYVSK